MPKHRSEDLNADFEVAVSELRGSSVPTFLQLHTLPYTLRVATPVR